MSVHPLPGKKPGEVVPIAKAEPPIRAVPDSTCALCGAPLGPGALSYRLVSPRNPERTLVVCHHCRKAALGEGYRPAG